MLCVRTFRGKMWKQSVVDTAADMVSTYGGHRIYEEVVGNVRLYWLLTNYGDGGRMIWISWYYAILNVSKYANIGNTNLEDEK